MSDSEPKDYLTQHLEPETPQDLSPQEITMLEEFYRPTQNVNFESEGKTILKKGEISIAFSWIPSYQTTIPQAQYELMEYWGYDPDELVILKDLILLNDKNGAELTINDLLPVDMLVVFDPYSQRPGTSSFFGDPDMLLITEPLTIPSAIATMFHEAGHVDDFSKRPEVQAQNFRIEKAVWDEGPDSLSEEDAETFLRYERNAWAFALTKLKPFISNTGPFPQKAISSLVHNESLHYKSEAIRKRIPK